MASTMNRLLLLAALLLPALTACSQPFDEDEDTESSGGIADKLLGILVTPEEVLLPVGSELQLKATGLLEGRETADLTSAVTWSMDDDGVASVSNDLDSEGVLYGVNVGSALLLAELEGVVSPGVTVRVVDADIERLSVNPTSVTIDAGDEVQLRAYATFSDGSEGEVSSQVRWKVADGSVATVEDDGLVTAKVAGSTTVQASWEDLSSSEVPVIVEPASTGGSGGGGDDDAADLTISAASGSISGGYLDLSVTVANTGGSSATGFWVDIFVDPSGTPGIGDIGDDYEWIDYLAAEDDDTLSFQIPVSGSSAKVTVLVDTTDEIDEADESDNSFSTTLSGGSGGGTDGPDLEVTYFDFLADAYTLYYYVDVTNSGDEDIEDLFYVDLFLDEYSDPSPPADGDAYQSVSSLAAGETTWVDFELENTCYYCYSYVLLDSYDYIDETSESNNTDGPLTVYY